MNKQQSATQHRVSEHAVDPLFLERWSSRAYEDRAVEQNDLLSLFEAARWAASCFNDQPWHFRYVTRQGDHAGAAQVLVEGNRSWAEAAPVLGVVFTRRHLTRTGAPNDWARFDAGAASAQMALRAAQLGLSVHLMAGFDPQAAYAFYGMDEAEWDAVAAFSIGYPGDPTMLPEALAEREVPSSRKPLGEVAQEVRS